MKTAIYKGLKTGAITGGIMGLVLIYGSRLFTMGLSVELKQLSSNAARYLLEMGAIITVFAVGGCVTGAVWGIVVKEKKKYFKAGLVIISATVSIFLYVLVILLFIATLTYYPKVKFDREKWSENVEERYKMSENIIESKILIGKTKDEVVELLGDNFYDCVIDPYAICYTLGYAPGLFNIDPDILRIYFKDGVVIKVEQYTS